MFLQITFSVVFSFLVSFLLFNKKRTVIYKTNHKDGWIYIEDQPVPDDIFVDILITDGKKVRHCIAPMYNKNGKLIISYDPKEEVIAWMPFPRPAKKR